MKISRTVLAAFAVVALGGLLAGCAPSQPTVRPAATESAPVSTDAFEPGHIVSDDSFYNSGSMSADAIQEFLEDMTCRPVDGVPCLADYTEDTRTEPDQGVGHCAEYRGHTDESAAEIIERVGVACGISPRALLVLLQKEQSLLTHPSERGYLRATGYGCPDTADCDQKYFGFFNQVYNAAWQFRQYTVEPDRKYRIGAVDVGYNPDAGCGASTVDIENQATANLYNYTPYQPNEATLADPDTGDGCSAWGNLNFWILWNRWFGDPTAERYPGYAPPCQNLVGGRPCTVPIWDEIASR